MLASILMPSRERFDALNEAVESILSTADDPSRIEILIKVDDDDPQLSLYQSLPHRIVVSPRGGGYSEMHRYFNELSEASVGHWLFLFNDDARIATQGWDTVLAESINSLPAISILWPEAHDGSNLFPVLSRSFYEAIGHFALSPHSDSYAWFVARGVDREFRVDIEVLHLRNTFSDRTKIEGEAHHHITSPAFHSPEIQGLIAEDIRKLTLLIKGEDNETM